MRYMLLVSLAITLAGCGQGDERAEDVDPRTRALARRRDGISPEFIEKLVAKIERQHPPTGHDTWAIVDDVLSHEDTDSANILEQRVTTAVIKALRVKAENIFAVVCLGVDPPGTEDLKFVVANRTGRNVSDVSGVIQVRSSFGAAVESLKFSINEQMAPGGEFTGEGHWSLPPNLLDQLTKDDSRYKLKFVASKVTYTDGTVEQYP